MISQDIIVSITASGPTVICQQLLMVTLFLHVCAGVGGRWRKITNINISAGDDCPGEWRKATQSGVIAFVEWLPMTYTHFSQQISLIMEQATRRCVGELEDTRRDGLELSMYHILVEQLMKAMLLDYQSLMIVILVSTFGLLLVVMVKEIKVFSIVLVLFLM